MKLEHSRYTVNSTVELTLAVISTFAGRCRPVASFLTGGGGSTSTHSLIIQRKTEMCGKLSTVSQSEQRSLQQVVGSLVRDAGFDRTPTSDGPALAIIVTTTPTGRLPYQTSTRSGSVLELINGYVLNPSVLLCQEHDSSICIHRYLMGGCKGQTSIFVCKWRPIKRPTTISI